VRTVLKFAVPAGIAVTAVALPVYAHYLAHTGSVDTARSALITITTFCGALLVPILVPSKRVPAAGDESHGTRDWRPLLLTVAMIVLFGAIMALPIARWFYQIEPIPLADVVVLGLLSLAWALVVLVVRRLDIPDRLEARRDVARQAPSA
jgi:hypothetical protein